MTKLTVEQIKSDLEIAAYVERLMPPVRPPKYRCCMPDIIYTPQEIAFIDRRPVPPRPTQEQIAIWEKVVLKWLPALEPEEVRLVWKRANHIPWKLLCREFGADRVTIWRKYDRALSKLLILSKQKMLQQKSMQHFRKNVL